MEIGRLNRRIDILTFVVERDTFGGEDGEWIITQSIWANIHTTSGIEFFNNQKVNAEAETIITVRFNPAISVMNRVRYADKLYEITSVVDQETSHKRTIISCKEMVSNGLQCKTEEG